MLKVTSQLAAALDTYTVMADCGVGEFLWRRRSDKPGPPYVGGNLYSLMDERCSPPDEMTAELFAAFCQWARWYMSTDSHNTEIPRNINWVEFNAEGKRLAQRLKRELGNSALVVYAKAWDDPTKNEGRYSEITADDV